MLDQDSIDKSHQTAAFSTGWIHLNHLRHHMTYWRRKHCRNGPYQINHADSTREAQLSLTMLIVL